LGDPVTDKDFPRFVSYGEASYEEFYKEGGSLPFRVQNFNTSSYYG
jgi:hypothetical protein